MVELVQLEPERYPKFKQEAIAGDQTVYHNWLRICSEGMDSVQKSAEIVHSTHEELPKFKNMDS